MTLRRPWRKAEGQTTEQGFNWRSRRCWFRRTSCSASSAIRTRPIPSKVHPISDIELASRLSYFLWSSMPDDELLGAGRSRQTARPGVLDAQVKRMLADPRSAAFADNFAGQWLETAQPGRRQARPAEVPGLESGAARCDEDGDAHVLRPHPAREPAALRFPGCQLHLPERAPGQALRHRRRDGPGVPPRRADHRPARRHPRARPAC